MCVVVPVALVCTLAATLGSSGLHLPSSRSQAATPTAGTFVSLPPKHLLDTRSGLGAPQHPVAANGTVSVQVLGRAHVPASKVSSVVLRVTVENPVSAGYLSVFARGGARSTAARLTFLGGKSVPAVVVAPVGSGGRIDLFNHSAGAVQLVADVAGYVRSPAVRAPAASVSRYVRDITGRAGDAAKMQDQGCADAKANGSTGSRLVLLDIGAQSIEAPLTPQTPGVQLSATRIYLSYQQLVTALEGYVHGYVSCRRGSATVRIAVGTNSDGNFATYGAGAKGEDWAELVVEPLRAYATAERSITIEGANDIEVSFAGTEAEAETWVTSYLGRTPADLIFVGSADRCPTSIGVTAQVCIDGNRTGWTQADYYNLAHGLSADRIVAVPQIYNADNAAQWADIDRTGVSRAGGITFIGVLTESPLCGSGCDFTPAQAFAALSDALSSDLRTQPMSLTLATNLRVDR